MEKFTKSIAIAIITAAVSGFAFASGEIKGLIKDEMGNPLSGVQIKVLAGEHTVTGTATDIDGKYSIKPIEAGKYDLVITYPLYKLYRTNNVAVIDEEATYVDVEMKPFGTDSVAQVVAEYKKPPVDPRVTTMKTIGAEEMSRMAISRGDIKAALVAVSPDVYQDPDDGMLYVRGARKDATQYFIDGDKLIGSMNVPATAIQSATIITGGIPAQYGDLTGGVVIITTKDYFSGMREKTMWQRDREERKAQAAFEQKKKEEAEKRAKEIEAEKQKLKEEKEKKMLEEQKKLQEQKQLEEKKSE